MSASRTTAKRKTGQPAVDSHLDRGHRHGRAADDSGIDESDQGDEQPDADADGNLELRRNSDEHRSPESGEHQHQDDQPFDHHQAHRVSPGHLARDREGDERVEAEPGGRGRWGLMARVMAHRVTAGLRDDGGQLCDPVLHGRVVDQLILQRLDPCLHPFVMLEVVG